MSVWLVLGSALWLGVLTSLSPCPMATNVAAISFLGRGAGKPGRVMLSGLLYTLGRTAAYVGLGMVILYLLRGSDGATGMLSRFMQRYMNLALGPVLIVVGMILLGLLGAGRSLTLAGQRLQDRVAQGGVLWALPLGVLFALSFCPSSAAFFFGALIGLSTQHNSPVLLPTLYGVGTALPVIGFALLMAFGSQLVGKAFAGLTRVERWVRLGTGVIFVGVGLYYTLRYIYGLPLLTS